MRPIIVVNRPPNPLCIDFHLGFNITRDNSYVHINVKEGELELAIKNSFEGLNKRGGYLVGRISCIPGIEAISLATYELNIRIEEGYNFDEIEESVVKALQFVIPPKRKFRAAVFVDNRYHIFSKYNKPHD